MRDRFSFRSALAGGLVAAMVMTAMPVLAGVGDAILLGAKNVGSAETEIQGSEYGPLVRFDNNHADGRAARFEVKPGNSPFVVNSNKKVKKLNADRVDGYSAKQLAPRAVWGATNDAPDGDVSDAYVLTAPVSIDAPAPGTVIIQGSVTGTNTSNGLDNILCYVRVDGDVIQTSQRFHEWPGNSAGSCATSGAVNVPAGDNIKIELVITSVAFNTNLDEATVQGVWYPFDGAGDSPFVP